MSLSFRVVIPARYGSTRLPGKPLRLIGGRPMVQHVWNRALESGCTDAVVATDDERIVEAVRAFGGRAVLTSPHHDSGTARIAEVVDRLRFASDDLVVNLQGDEPFMTGDLVRRVAAALAGQPAAEIATAATPIRTVAELFDPNAVKVVLDQRSSALYFSRAPIPWARDQFPSDRAPEALPDGTPFLRHIGLYAYRCAALARMIRLPPAPAERAECLEQLRALAAGMRIHVVVRNATTHGVDTEADLARAQQLVLQSVK